MQHFITNDKVNVAGLVLAGSADFKTELSQSDLLDLRLQAKIVKIVDISYGMEVGWQQAIDLSSEALSNVKFVQEKKLIQKYFDEIAQDTGKYIYGVDDTLKTLELGAVETLIIWENLDLTRHVLRNAAGGMFLSPWFSATWLTVLAEIHIVHTWPGDPKRKEKFEDKATGLEMEAAEEAQSLLEWLAEHYKEFGCALEFVSDKSQEGSQFVKGFSGIGGILRYVPRARVDVDECMLMSHSRLDTRLIQQH